jgi:Spirocyclase AveC-like
MSATHAADSGRETLSGAGRSVDAVRRGWSLPHYLALVGVPVLVWNAWTVIAWLAAGPHAITAYRHGHTVDWYGARAFEALAIVIGVVLAVYVYRGCRRARMLLTFDFMFCLAAATQFWGDAGVNFMAPTITISSNWVNVNAACGHMPLIVNPDCGRTPDPILFLVLLETFVPLACAIVFGRMLSRVRARRPDLSTAQLVWLVIAAGFALALLEPLVIIPLHLWNYPGTPPAISLGGGFRYPVWEIACFGLWFGVLAAVRIFRDDRGRTIVEHGLDHHRPATRKAITLMALYTIFQIAIWAFASMPYWVIGLHQHRWPAEPRQLVNGMCDAPGVTGTRYGPCPGSPGFRMPVPGSLAGSSP